MSQAPGLCLTGTLDALAQYVFTGIEHDMEHGLPGVVQASEYLLQASAGQDRLRGNEVLPSGRPRWIDYRTTIDTGETLHLHVVARGD